MASFVAATPRRRALAVGFLLVALLLIRPTESAQAQVDIVVSEITGTDGRVFWAKNHLVRTDDGVESLSGNAAGAPAPGEYLIVWAGDANATDVSLADSGVVTDPPAPDFLAVINADRSSSGYGDVVNTVTVGPVLQNEPHHMQYLYHKGDRVFAGGLYTDTTFVFDVSNLPVVTLAGVNQPQDTPCSSVPDAFWTLDDHTAYGTYMGGANVPGPCLYSNGEVRVSNGYGGSPGAIVHMGPDGKTLSEVPAALPTSEDPVRCPNYPAIPGQATCANPHGIQAREDLDRMIASDYAEPRNIVLNPLKPSWDDNIFRSTVRIFDITDQNNPQLSSVSVLPESPRPSFPVAPLVGGVMQVTSKWGIMETTVTNLPQNKGAFASSMCGGVLYYTPDITSPSPQWREVFDDTTAARFLTPGAAALNACAGAGWIQTSPDDRFLYRAVIGRNAGLLGPADPGIPKMVYVLDISSLVAAGTSTTCSIDSTAEILDGGTEPECPVIASALPLPDDTTGGPHWGAIDNFVKLPTGHYTETTDVRRIAVSNYFVGRTAVDGNHQVCMINLDPKGILALDGSFKDEIKNTPCVDFDRTNWPHGPHGNAKPHSELFVVPDAMLQ